MERVHLLAHGSNTWDRSSEALSHHGPFKSAMECVVPTEFMERMDIASRTREGVQEVLSKCSELQAEISDILSQDSVGIRIDGDDWYCWS